MQIKPKLLALVGTGVAVAALGIAVPTMAFAQDPAPSASGSPSASADGSDSATGPDREQRQAERQDRMAELLASELGLDKATVAAALDTVESQLRDEAKTDHQAALKERLDAAVAAGTLTQEQADAIVAASAAGVLDGGPGGHGHNGHDR